MWKRDEAVKPAQPTGTAPVTNVQATPATQPVAPRVEALCARYGIPYNKGSFARQLGTTLRTIFRLALPTRSGALAPA